MEIFGPKVLGRLSQSKICEALGLLSQKQMATKLGLTYEVFRWRVTKGVIPKPEIRLARRAYYSAEQIEALEMLEAQSNNTVAIVKEGNNNESKT